MLSYIKNRIAAHRDRKLEDHRMRSHTAGRTYAEAMFDQFGDRAIVSLYADLARERKGNGQLRPFWIAVEQVLESQLRARGRATQQSPSEMQKHAFGQHGVVSEKTTK